MKKKILITSAVVLLTLILASIYIYTQDNLKFKLNYEVYNHLPFENGKTITTNIAMDNPVKYVNQEELQKLFNKEEAVIYFGYPTCPWCRNIVPTLLEVLEENNIDTLYYVDVKEINTKSILNILEEYLETDEDGNKKLYVPDIYFIKNGKIVYHHLGTVESYKNAFLGMNKKQITELKSIYQKGIDLIKGDDEND